MHECSTSCHPKHTGLMQITFSMLCETIPTQSCARSVLGSGTKWLLLSSLRTLLIFEESFNAILQRYEGIAW